MKGNPKRESYKETLKGTLKGKPNMPSDNYSHIEMHFYQTWKPMSEMLLRRLCMQHSSSRGRPHKLSIAETLKKIFFVCKTGCQWRAIEGMDGVSCKTVYHWFRTWSKARVFEHEFYNLVKAYSEAIFKPLVCDTSFLNNVFGHEKIGHNPTDRGRNATKVSLLTESSGVPLAMTFHNANKSDFRSLGHLLQEGQRKLERPLQMHREL